MKLMDAPRTVGQEVRHPPTVKGTVSLGVGQRRIKRFATIAMAPKQNTS